MGVINLIKSKATQTAVYWGTAVNDGRGKHTFSVTEEVLVRWEDLLENFSINTQGNTRIGKDGKEYRSRATVLTSNVPTGGWDVDGYLYLGDLDDLDSAPIPYDTADAYEIKELEALPSLNNVSEKFYVIHL